MRQVTKIIKITYVPDESNAPDKKIQDFVEDRVHVLTQSFIYYKDVLIETMEATND